MRGALSWEEIRSELPQDVQDRLDEKALRRRVGEAMAELRKRAKLTQTDLATLADVPQGNVSRTERSDDMLLSSIHRYMSALGGSAELVLRTPNGQEVRVEI